MTLEIYADENIPGLREYLGDAVNITFFSGRELTAAQLRDADALLVRSVTRVQRELLQGTPVRFVGSATSGFDHIDQAYLQAAGIAFSHAPGSNANSVVEYVLAAIAADEDRLERLLAGGRVGIVGYGHVGRALARRLLALDISHCFYDPWLDPLDAPGGTDLDEILGCDVVSLHCELTLAEPWPSYHLLDGDTIARLANGALLINASRGSVIAQAALLRRLVDGTLRAVLDVWEGEPDIDTALLQHVQIGTAHIAGYSADGKALATHMLCDALAAHFNLADIPRGQFLPARPSLQVRQGASGATLLRSLVQAQYDIRMDDALLRDCAAQSAGEQLSRGFDMLRKGYRLRRELAGSTVHATGLSADDRRLIAALGCQLGAGAGEP